MVKQNREIFRTDFQVSVDAAHGISSGISAADRARTIGVMASPTAVPDDLVQPGHVFPLRAKSGGVLQRAGHTEATVDLVTLAGARPIGVICEIMNDDGTMARLPALSKFARKHRLKICTIADLIHYRRAREKLVERVEVVKMPTDYGDFDLHLYRSKVDGLYHLALVRGEVAGKPEVLVRVHSECLTGDVFGSRRCDCGPQLHQAMRQVADGGRGVILYMRQEGRGIGLAPKIKAYKLQEQGLDTGGGQSEARLWHGPARIWFGGTDSGGSGVENHSPADQQPQESRRAQGLRAGNHPAGAHQDQTQSAQRALSEDQAREVGASIVIYCGQTKPTPSCSTQPAPVAVRMNT